MHPAPLPLTRDLVLIGGGHTHALVLRMWGMAPLPGARLTLINPGPTAPYSGMLPGYVAGHYTRDELDIDLVKLARFAGARLILGAATGIDLERREVAIEGHAPIGFDVASVDIGITSDMPALSGFAQHAVPAKPLGPFAHEWAAFLEGDGPARVVVIGGGVAGAELAMAMRFALTARNRDNEVTLLDSATALSALRPKAADKLRARVAASGVRLVENTAVTRVTAEGVDLASGKTLPANFVTGTAGARAYDWVSRTGLEVTDGFIRVGRDLRSSDPAIFATGDCAHLAFDPRPKAGVYAVRQAPILLHNLRAALTGGTAKHYRPQKDYLKLISLGGKEALGDRFGQVFSGPWVWRWKDRIDRKFMDKFRDLPKMPAPALPRLRAQGVDEALGPKPMCGGCGAKVGRGVLSDALRLLPPSTRADVAHLPGDDAALLTVGGARQVMTTDHLRSLWPDPHVMARIAAVHALGDIWAMGAAPQAATLSVTLPRLSDSLARRMMGEIVMAASEIVGAAGAEIVGGHSTIGDELTIGLTITGLCDAPPLTLAGARAGDALILTKPLGSGTIMAAEMAGEAAGAWVVGALEQMQVAQGAASDILKPVAHAMTDVTGFGLAGHLQGMCLASGTGAVIDLAALPLMNGAETLSAAGLRSSLFPKNRQGFEALPRSPRADLLFDPQTGGGLLAAVPAGDAGALCAKLKSTGYADSAIVGTMVDAPAGQISLR